MVDDLFIVHVLIVDYILNDSEVLIYVVSIVVVTLRKHIGQRALGVLGLDIAWWVSMENCMSSYAWIRIGCRGLYLTSSRSCPILLTKTHLFFIKLYKNGTETLSTLTRVTNKCLDVIDALLICTFGKGCQEYTSAWGNIIWFFLGSFIASASKAFTFN